MSPDLLASRLMLLIPVAVIVFVTGTGALVVRHGLKHMVDGESDGPPGWLWQSVLFVAVVDLIFCAVLDVGQALVLFTESWGGIVGVCATLFGPWLGFKAFGRYLDARGSNVDTTGGGNT